MNRLQNIVSKTFILIILIIVFSCNRKQLVEYHAFKIYLNGMDIQDEEKIDCTIELTDSLSMQTVKGGIEYRGSSSKL